MNIPQATSSEFQLTSKATGASHPLKGEVLIGREHDCTVQLKEPKIRSYHAKISVSEDGIFLEDLNSRNNTYLNGCRIGGGAWITLSDEINFDGVKFKVDPITVKAAETPTDNNDKTLAEGITPSNSNVKVKRTEALFSSQDVLDATRALEERAKARLQSFKESEEHGSVNANWDNFIEDRKNNKSRANEAKWNESIKKLTAAEATVEPEKFSASTLAAEPTILMRESSESERGNHKAVVTPIHSKSRSELYEPIVDEPTVDQSKATVPQDPTELLDKPEDHENLPENSNNPAAQEVMQDHFAEFAATDDFELIKQNRAYGDSKDLDSDINALDPAEVRSPMTDFHFVEVDIDSNEMNPNSAPVFVKNDFGIDDAADFLDVAPVESHGDANKSTKFSKAATKELNLGSGPRLLAQTAPIRGKCYALAGLNEKKTWTIGRAPNVDVILNDRGIDLIHAHIELTDSGHKIRTTRASNGLLINGKFKTEAILEHGDVLQFGRMEFLFRDDIVDETPFQPQNESRKINYSMVIGALVVLGALLAALLSTPLSK
jgi:pSer/pThr/pTyr-binding forkhead associated (FHA) protein